MKSHDNTLRSSCLATLNTDNVISDSKHSSYLPANIDNGYEDRPAVTTPLENSHFATYDIPSMA